jgi:hypothetical protein
MQKAQSSVEIIVFLGVALIFVLVFIAISSNTLIDMKQQQEMSAAKQAASKLADAADYVYFQGDGASVQVQITLPQSANLSPNATYIGKPPSASPSAPSNMININVLGTDVTAYARASLSGSLPSSPGTYVLNVTSHGTFVNIGEELLSALPSSVHLTVASGETAFYYITFSSSSPSPVFVNISKSWQNQPSLSVFPSSFSFSKGAAAVRLNFTTNESDRGLYEGYLVVNATSTTSPWLNASFTIPVSLKVVK